MPVNRWSLVTVVAAAALAVPATAAHASPSPTPEPTPPPYEPCPVVALDPPPQRPEQPEPPRHRLGEREIGGVGLATDGLTVPEGAPDLPDNLSATYWLVADLDTGDVLGACGPHEYAIPASTLKLLLAATLLDRLDPDEVIEVTHDDLQYEPGSSAVGLVAGGEYTVETLWLGLLLNSGNDAANVLARLGGGEQGVAGTLAAMNATARHLGAHQTHAATPSGLDGPGQFSSAYDLALIARAVFDREDFSEYIATLRAEIPAQSSPNARGFEFQNNNRLMFNYAGALGGKTGYTNLARHAYVGAAERDGRRLVVTLLGAEARPVRSWQQGAALLDWGFDMPRNASVGRLVDPGETADQTVFLDEGAVGPGSPPAPRQSLGQVAAVWTAWSVAAVALVIFAGAVLLLVIGRIVAGRR
jgi:serine-type D-Ala-D-Ala carboxypeptidase (penicillin-binding protein 5/6)